MRGHLAEDGNIVEFVPPETQNFGIGSLNQMNQEHNNAVKTTETTISFVPASAVEVLLREKNDMSVRTYISSSSFAASAIFLLEFSMEYASY